tara:strand:- start:4 stop:411 length:408 start_codon:yes stop_codon:yes gene_type:complete
MKTNKPNDNPKFTLPKEFKEKWINALRSGLYKQGSGSLVHEHQVTGVISYCCLGVACEIAGEDMDYADSEEWITNDYSGYTFDKVPKQLHGEGEINSLVEELARMNDDTEQGAPCSHLFNFDDIAMWIKRNVKGV